jgi:hypothetical protein
VRYASCDYDLLPHWEIGVELEGGSRIQLAERFEPAASRLDTGSAALVGAAVGIGNHRQVVADYWRLVYAARRHNRHARYWVLLESVLQLEGLKRPVGAVEVAAPEPDDETPPAVFYLDEDFQVLAAPVVTSYDKRSLGVYGAKVNGSAFIAGWDWEDFRRLSKGYAEAGYVLTDLEVERCTPLIQP